MLDLVQLGQPAPRTRRLLLRLCLLTFCGGLLLLLSSRPAVAAERREPQLLDPVAKGSVGLWAAGTTAWRRPSRDLGTWRPTFSSLQTDPARPAADGASSPAARSIRSWPALTGAVSLPGSPASAWPP
jgi:hypothetical protein